MPFPNILYPSYFSSAISGIHSAYDINLLTRKPYSTQTISGPPPCPVNIKQQDWDEQLHALEKNLTLHTWSEAVACGFSKTPMGQSTGWFWHDILIEKYGLSHLPTKDYRHLSQMLELLWIESMENPCEPTAEEQRHETMENQEKIYEKNASLLTAISGIKTTGEPGLRALCYSVSKNGSPKIFHSLIKIRLY
jgi:hypothetical protein